MNEGTDRRPAVDRHAVLVLGPEVLSRSAFMCAAMRSMALVPRNPLPPPSNPARALPATSDGSRLYLRRAGRRRFGHRVPRLTGLSGSPSIWMISDCEFFDLSPVE